LDYYLGRLTPFKNPFRPTFPKLRGEIGGFSSLNWGPIFTEKRTSAPFLIHFLGWGRMGFTWGKVLVRKGSLGIASNISPLGRFGTSLIPFFPKIGKIFFSQSFWRVNLPILFAALLQGYKTSFSQTHWGI